jgi:putative chitinase
MLSAGWFWDVNKLNIIADKGKSDDIVSLITRRVNGGLNGIEDRIQKFNKIYNILNI